MMKIVSGFMNVVALYRERIGISQEELARAAGTTVEAVRKAEAGVVSKVEEQLWEYLQVQGVQDVYQLDWLRWSDPPPCIPQRPKRHRRRVYLHGDAV